MQADNISIAKRPCLRPSTLRNRGNRGINKRGKQEMVGKQSKPQPRGKQGRSEVSKIVVSREDSEHSYGGTLGAVIFDFGLDVANTNY
jgi:hypothetical protein